MTYKKVLPELLITAFLSFFIYSLIDLEIFGFSDWDVDKVLNIIHLWVMMISAYYIYNTCLQAAYNSWSYISSKKLIIILISTSLIVICWVILVDILYYKLYYNVDSLFEETTFYDFDLPVSVVVITIGSLFFYQKYYTEPLKESDDQKESWQKLSVNKGQRQVFIDVSTVGLFIIENELVRVYTLDGQQFHTDNTLSSILENLSDKNFFRLNRQSIISRQAVKEVEKSSFQKLQVQPVDLVAYKQQLVVSKYNAPAFKKWLNQFTG